VNSNLTLITVLVTVIHVIVATCRG